MSALVGIQVTADSTIVKHFVAELLPKHVLNAIFPFPEFPFYADIEEKSSIQSGKELLILLYLFYDISLEKGGGKGS
jgi:hypothetical protein